MDAACLQAWCDGRGLDTVIHPITKSVVFLEDLLEEMRQKSSKDPFGTIRVARKALSKIRCASMSILRVSMLYQIWHMCAANRELQRGVPPPYGEAFSKETLIRSASSKAFAATTEARVGET